MSDDELRAEITSDYYKTNLGIILAISLGITWFTGQLHYGFYAFTIAGIGMWMHKEGHVVEELAKRKAEDHPCPTQ